MRTLPFTLIVLSCVFPLTIHAMPPETFVPARYDPFVGDWLPKKAGDCVAQVLATGANAYQVNVLAAFDDESSAEPVAVLRGTRPDENSPVELRDAGGDWTGTIRPDCCASPQMVIINAKAGEKNHLAQFMRPNPRLRTKPPEGAIVLFADRMRDGVFTLAKEQAKLASRETFGNVRAHLEFRMSGDGSAAAATLWKGAWIGLFSSYGRSGRPACGTLLTTGPIPPAVRAERAVLEWQALDVETRDGWMTVFLNGVKIHDAVAGIAAPGEQAPLEIETRGAPVAFRNIWVLAQ
ncbi:MAG: DUF1080 domain-containing protein [Opitutaceae bacterium]|jgi:hypothetical protein|nr:DUF1080 domain-containing protein [Opitutaceae bacterium]